MNNKPKVIYACSCIARLNRSDVDIYYNDIDPKYNVDFTCSCLDLNLSDFDIILGSPPCNFYSRANYRRYTSKYSLETKNLLPLFLVRCAKSGKPFIVENVRNSTLLAPIFCMCACYGIHVYVFGRHTYFTNIYLDLRGLTQIKDNIQFKYHISNNISKYRQGGFNVDVVFNRFIDLVLAYE